MSARHIALDETTTRASQGRTSKDAMTVVMVSPLSIVELSFLCFVLYLFLRKIFHGVAKILETGISLSRNRGLHGIRTQSETKEETVEQHRVYHLVAHAAVH
jgi:hypothetical protein